MPLFVKKFLVDFIETALGLIVALNLAFPGSVQDVKDIALVIGGAILSALVSAGRRALPDILAYVRERIGV